MEKVVVENIRDAVLDELWGRAGIDHVLDNICRDASVYDDLVTSLDERIRNAVSDWMREQLGGA